MEDLLKNIFGQSLKIKYGCLPLMALIVPRLSAFDKPNSTFFINITSQVLPK